MIQTTSLFTVGSQFFTINPNMCSKNLLTNPNICSILFPTDNNSKTKSTKKTHPQTVLASPSDRSSTYTQTLLEGARSLKRRNCVYGY